MEKKIAIVGAGALGAHVGAYLTRDGRDITLIDPWPEHVEKMRSEGITLCGQTEPENFTVPVKAIHLTELQQTSKERPFDFAFVSMKSYDTIWASAMIQQYLAPNGYLVSLQNSINEERIASVVGWGKTIGCIASSIAVELVEPALVHRYVKLGGDVFRVGEVHGRETQRVKEIAQMLSCCDNARVTSNLWGERWTKLAVNSMRNPVSAATGRGANHNDRDAVTRRLSIRLAGELVKIGLAQGYELSAVYKMDPNALLAASEGDESAMQACEKILLDNVKLRNDEQRPSMGQDMAKGRRTEIDYINGLVVAKARELGIDAPVNEGMAEVVRRVERGEVVASPQAVAHL